MPSQKPRVKDISIEDTFGKNTASYLHSNISDSAYIRALQGRLDQIAVGPALVKAQLAKGRVYDLGGESINDSLTAAVINIEESTEFATAVAEQLHTTVRKENLAATLFTRRYLDAKRSRDAGAPVFGRRQFILFLHILESHKGSVVFGVHLLADSRLSCLLYKRINSDALRAPIPKILDSSVPHANGRLMGMYNRILVAIDTTWHWANVVEVGRLGAASFSRDAMFTPDEYIVMTIKGTEKATELQHLPVTALKASAASDPLVFVEAPNVALSFGLDVSTLGTPVEEEGAYRYGNPDDTGPAGCSNFGTPDSCKNCCTQWLTYTSGTVALAATTCAAKTGWPLMLACFAAATIAEGVLYHYFVQCKNNCDKVYWNEDYITYHY